MESEDDISLDSSPQLQLNYQLPLQGQNCVQLPIDTHPFEHSRKCATWMQI